MSTEWHYDGWENDDPWRDDDPAEQDVDELDEVDWKDVDPDYYEELWGPPKEEPDCLEPGCYDSGYDRHGQPCRGCNPPDWLIRWWAISSALTEPVRRLRRRLRRKPYDDDGWGPF